MRIDKGRQCLPINSIFKLVIFLGTSLFFSETSLAQVNLTQGLVAYYPFNGNANDASGNGNNGILQGGVQLTTDRFGTANSAYLFDGVDDYISVPDAASLDPANSISIALYFNASRAGLQNLIGKIAYTGGVATQYQVAINYTPHPGVLFGVNPASNGCIGVPINSAYVSTGGAVNINQWYCVVATFDNGVEKIYLDGALLQTINTGFTTLTQCTNATVQIGKWWSGDQLMFKGKIDDIRIYNRALNTDEVNALCGLLVDPCSNWLSTPTQPSWVNVGDLDVPGTQLTVEAEVNIKGIVPGGNIDGEDVVSKHIGPPDANYLLRTTHAEMSTVNGFFTTPTTCPMEMNKTYHIAMVYDGTTLKYYRDGFLMGQVPATGAMLQNNDPTAIGFISTRIQPENFIGYINEVRIWNVARTQAQIRQYMSSSLPNPTTQVGLQAYYTFDNLVNKQGNAAWNGTLEGNASINAQNPECAFSADTCSVVAVANFDATDTVCVNAPVTITNNSQNASSYYWSFCAGSPNTPPIGLNLGNPGGALIQPVFSDIVKADGNYYVFVSGNIPGRLTRLDFGNSLLNTPTAVNLGNLGVIPSTGEGIQVVYNNGHWFGIMVAGDVNVGFPSKIMRFDFGANITNTSPNVTDWGNIGNLAYPVDLHLFQENDNWYGLTVNADNNTITRFDFTNNLNNTPTGVNLGNLGGLNYPTGIFAIADAGNWSVFVTNDIGNSLVRLDFGNSLLNTPTAANLGNLGGALNGPRDLVILKDCSNITGFILDGHSVNKLIKLNFTNGLMSVPTATDLGNIGNLSFPHSISKLFRVDDDIYCFVTNVTNNTLTRLRFPGCTNSSIPTSTATTPPTVSYDTPGTYNINLTVDDGLLTQTSFCQQVVVLPPLGHHPIKVLTICEGDSVKVGTSVVTGTHVNSWNNGQTADSIYISQAGTYWVETNRFDCLNRDSFQLVVNPVPVSSLGPDGSFCTGKSLLLDAGIGSATYTWNTGASSQTISVNTPGRYSVILKSSVGCSAYDSIDVSLYPKPAIVISSPTEICKNSSIQLSVTGGTTYSWTPTATLDDPLSSTPTAAPIADTTMYVAAVTDPNHCTYLDSVRITIKPLPVFSVNTPTPICVGDHVQLIASGGSTYNWLPTAGLDNGGISNPTASPIITTDYSVLITEPTCHQSTTLMARVIVNDLPSLILTKSNDLDCSMGQSQLTAQGASTYIWTPSTGLSNPNIYNPVASPFTTTLYTVTARDRNGCSNEDTVSVKVIVSNSGGYLMPNAFTPNGDGLNDCYSMKYWGVIQELEFSVYNRWGQRIFFTKDPNQCWDGTFHGVKQDPDVYVYMIKAKTSCENAVFRKGTFVLIR